MSRDTITAKELAKIMNKTTRSIQRQARNEAWPSRTLNARGDKAYPIDSLPTKIQAVIAEKTDMPSSLLPSLAPEAALVAAKRMAEASPPLPGPRIVPLMTWQKKKALAWADLVRLYLEFVRSRAAWGAIGQMKDAFVMAYNAGAYPIIYKEVGATSVQTLERKVADLKRAENDCFVALAPKYGGRRGKRSINDDAAQILLSIVRSPYNPKKTTEIIRIARTIMDQRGVQDGLSDATYRRWLQDWTSRHYDEWIFWTEGEKGLNDKVSYWIERDYSKIEVGDVLVADGHVLNFDTLNPWTGKPKRMTLILWQDMKSSYPLGWEIMPTENTQAISAALRRAIIRLGKAPKIAYLDNGKAFAGRFFNGLNLEEAGFSGVFERLGIRPVYAWPYHGQSKTVERFFGCFAELERLSPSYSGTSIEARPPRLSRGERLHVGIHDRITGGRVPTLLETHQAIGAWFDEWVRRPHVDGHLKGLTSLEVLEPGCGPGVDRDELRFLMMAEEIRTIRRRGIRLFGEWYYHPALYGRNHHVVVRYDIEDPSYILVLEPETDNLICRATLPPKVHPMADALGDEADQALLREEIEFKRALEKRTTGSARAFVKSDIIPELQQRIENNGFGAGKPALPQKSTKEKVVRLSDADKTVIQEQLAVLQAESQGAGKIDWERLHDMSDMDRYERLVEYEMQRIFIPKDERNFMRYFEQTDTFTRLSEHFADYRTKMALMYQTEESYG